MTSVSKNVYIDILDDIINKHNNTYHSSIKMKPNDVKSNPYTDSRKKNINRNPNFGIGGIVRISKHKNIFAKGYFSKLVFLNKFL